MLSESILTACTTAQHSEVIRSSIKTYESEAEPNHELPNDSFATAMNPKRNYLIFIGKGHPYTFNGGYDRLLRNDLVSTTSAITNEPIEIEKGALCAFTELQEDLHEKGLRIELCGAYQPKHRESDPVEYPYCCEHHTGLLLDITIDGSDDPEEANQVTEKILRESLADHGFINRYPAGKEGSTGFSADPYKIRFVGSSEIAHQIMDSNLCLEEYLKNYATSK
ncbi:D-alanyl-D-alanine carboxypeptidase family protein [Candidatus Saccharibacteria bacterium]|nr:D-alanyl-D-alanine carboxypeptidase family protein [Candidatus Saccharibacteria bacterium]